MMGLGWITHADSSEATDSPDWMPSLSSFWETVVYTGETMMELEKHEDSGQLKYYDQRIVEDVVYEPMCKRSRFSSLVNSSEHDDDLLNISRLTLKDPLTIKGLRNTRFSVMVSMDVAVNMFVLSCVELGTSAKKRAENEFLVTFKPNMSFVMYAYEFSDSNGTRVIMECRRSRGCGIAFKRIFNHLKKKMQPLICSDDDDWMRNAGLIRQN